jgi:dTDP-glucose 4,6-dehydratase
MLDSTETGPINMGNPTERTMLELAQTVLSITGSDSKIEHFPLPTDDPTRRRPDITQAETKLGWTPQVTIEVGLRNTVDFFAARMPDVASASYALAGAQYEGDFMQDLENPA